MVEPLSQDEQAILSYFKEHGTDAETRRAEIILLHHDDTGTSNIADQVDLSKSQVRHWVREWSKNGVAIFPPLPDQQPAAAPAGDVAVAPPAVAEVPAIEQEPAEQSALPFGAEANALSDVNVDDQPPAHTHVPDVRLPGIEGPRLPLALHDTIGLEPDEPMAEAGRKVLLFHFERMLLNEPGTRAGEDIEALHDMRVATRRMRSALRVVKPFFKKKAIKPYRKQLRRIARALGDVRDQDVMLEKAQHFVDDHPAADLSPLLDHWQEQREKARRALLAQLDSAKFDRFVSEFYNFLITPGAGARALSDAQKIVAYRVQHVAPRLIYERYARVRAYEPVIEDAAFETLHALRIDGKRLRYTLEFFEEVLGPEARDVIKELKKLQDHLGDLNDAVVAGDVLRAFTDDFRQDYSGVPLFMRPNLDGVKDYAAAKASERHHLLETFPETWARFIADEMRRKLALAVAVL
jgi:CHAD domain-containing protein/transposase-like protein